MWHVSSRSSVATLRTAIHLLLTYLLTLLSSHSYLSAAEPDVALETEMSTLKSSADGDFLAVALLAAAWFGDTSSVTSQPWTHARTHTQCHVAPTADAAITAPHPTAVAIVRTWNKLLLY